MSRSVLELLAGLHDLDGLLLAEREGHAVRSGVLRAEDELAEVGGAARDRDVVREGAPCPCRCRSRRPFSADAAARSTRMRPIFLTSSLDERLRQQERDAGAGRVESGRRSGRPSRRCVTFDATRGIFAVGHRLRHVGLAGGALVVDGRDHAGLVDRPHARHRLVGVGAVVAGGDLDARAVGAAAGVERLRRRLERGRLVLQREHRRLEDGHQADLQRRLRRVARAVVPQADGLVVDLLGRRRWCSPPSLPLVLAAAAARRGDERQRQQHREQFAPGVFDIPLTPPG